MLISKDIRYVGVNDHQIDLFEGQYKVPHGMSYNSYIIVDEKIAVLDTIEAHFADEWLAKIEAELQGRSPDYLVVHHMEPDHSANIKTFADRYPKAVIASSRQAFMMMKNYFGTDFAERQLVLAEGSKLELGKHCLNFVGAPMVHWPEVLMSYESTEKVLFSADGFGKFGALDVEENWADEARRYYIGIVGKYGHNVQNVLKKASALDIRTICPLHGPVLKDDLGEYIRLYDIWSSYGVESDGIMIAYTSVYGHTKEAVEYLAKQLESCCAKVIVHDLARDDLSLCVADAFRYGKLVLATTTYNSEIFPFMHQFIHHLTERFFQKRTIALIENGSWAPQAAKIMSGMLEGCKELNFLPTVTIRSSMNDANRKELTELAVKLSEGTACTLTAKAEEASVPHVSASAVATPAPAPVQDAPKIDMTALFKLSYGVFVLSTKAEGKINGCITNTGILVTNEPNRIAICVINKNLTCEMIKKSKVFTLSVLDQSCTFQTITHFGMQSGRDVNKFDDLETPTDGRGVPYIDWQTCAMISAHVVDQKDLGTHTLFIAEIDEAKRIGSEEALTYSDYQTKVKPKPAQIDKTRKIIGWRCKICGYVYEGEKLPADYLCPLCGHDIGDFEPVYA